MQLNEEMEGNRRLSASFHLTAEFIIQLKTGSTLYGQIYLTIVCSKNIL